MTFRETLDAHLRAIANRDLAALVETVAAGRLTLITSDGRLIERGDEFIAMHRDWFNSRTWTLDTRIIQIWEGADLGLAVIRLDYRDRPTGREPIHETSYLSLAFQKGGDRWLMVHDQNTPVRQRL
jgi:ketosteroid isomerase-like protein